MTSTSSTSTALLRRLLENLTNPCNPPIIREIVHPTATYISLNFSNPSLKRIMPWTGTHSNGGPDVVIETFTNVGQYWDAKDFIIQTIFGDEEGNVAAFGSVTFTGRLTGITKMSPLAVWAKVEFDESGEGKVVFMQFMEDTFATASTFEVAGEKLYRADPDGTEVCV
ncbi:hypothetical protein K469DRAFT_742515 [Zopfia rhizophila CBS 207.26]|uniref:SnoaL-like domain-containing protein n=1 Tax=Zopfia rhizophila CBS 207.26 TaxID=1314779 RepID=A0A6A6DEL2_9PEZI|nr:hypothetical protein K469DRAFT_742515 [Zopfia rhizophila CBS 207.26]